MLRKNISSKAIFAFGLCAVMASTVFAADNDALINALVVNGYLTKEQANDIQKDISEKADIAPAVIPSSRFVQSLAVVGRLQFQYANFHLSGKANEGRHGSDGFFFRRMLAGLGFELQNDWNGLLVWDFGGNDPDASINVAYIQWAKYKEAILSMGIDIVPFGYECVASSGKSKMIERSALSRVMEDSLLFTSNHTGLFLKGSFDNSPLSYGLYFGNNDNTNHRSDWPVEDRGGVPYNKYDGYSVYGRTELNFNTSDSSTLLVGLDLGYSQSCAYNAALTTDKDAAIYGAGAHLVFQSNYFSFISEASVLNLENSTLDGDDATFWGILVMPVFKVVDDFELVGSYTFMDSDGAYALIPGSTVRRSNASSVRCDQGQVYYFGFNWYLMGHDLKLQTGYEYGRFTEERGTGYSNISQGVRMQMQMQW